MGQKIMVFIRDIAKIVASNFSSNVNINLERLEKVGDVPRFL